MFSRRSLVAMLLSLTMFLIGINSQSGWLYWLAGLCLAAVVVSWVDSLLEVRGLEVERALSGEATEGSAIEVELRVHNRGRFSRNLLLLGDCDPRGGEGIRPRLRRRSLLFPGTQPEKATAHPAPAEGTALLLLPRLEGGGAATLRYLRGGLRRGVYVDWPAYVYSEGILCLALHHATLNPPSRLAVLPAYAELSAFPLLDACSRAAQSLASTSARGAGMDFYGVREFQVGDPLHHVHWKTTARVGSLAVREFEAQASSSLLIVIDNRDAAGKGKGYTIPLDLQARLAASMALYALTRGHPVTLAAFEGRAPTLCEVRLAHDALYWLASLAPRCELPPDEQLAELSPQAASHNMIFHVVLSAGMDWDRLASPPFPTCRVALVVVEAARTGRGRSAAGSARGEGRPGDLLHRLPPWLAGAVARLKALAAPRDIEDSRGLRLAVWASVCTSLLALYRQGVVNPSLVASSLFLITLGSLVSWLRRRRSAGGRTCGPLRCRDGRARHRVEPAVAPLRRGDAAHGRAAEYRNCGAGE